MDHGKRLFHTAEPGEGDGRGEVALGLETAQQFEAVHAGHDQIGDDDVGVEARQAFQRVQAVGSDLSFKSGLGEHGGQSDALALVIVDDQDSARHYGHLRH